MTDTLQPHSIEAEEAVLGAALINPDVLYDIGGDLQPDDFFIHRHGWLYGALQDMHEARTAIDYLTVVEELEQRGQLAEAGGAGWVLGLINKTPSALNAESYAQIVSDHADRRRLIAAAQRVVRYAHSEDTPIDEVLSNAEAAVLAVGERASRQADIVTYEQAASDEYDRQARMARLRAEGADPLDGVQAGVGDLDEILLVMPPGEIAIFAGRPGMGKTAFLTHILKHNAQRGVPGGILSLEMSTGQIARRLSAQHIGANTQRMEAGRLDEHELHQFTQHLASAGDIPIVINDTPALTPQQMRAIVQRMVRKHGVRFVIVDYLQLMRYPALVGDRTREVGAISRALKAMAKEFHIPVIAAAQLSRKVEQRTDKRPLLSDLRDSGEIEQDAYQVVFLYRDAYYSGDEQDRTVELIVAKHRNGPTGTARAVFDPESVTYHNAVRRDYDLDERSL